MGSRAQRSTERSERHDRTIGEALAWARENTSALTVERGERVSDLTSRPSVRARFVRIDGEKRYIRGVTYGTFSGNGGRGCPYPDAATVGRDFAAMAASGA